MSKKAWSPPAGRIPYLDGLRAFSITTVVLGHASLFIPWLSTRVGTAFGVVFANSSFGVRVFFVLSGFLITTLLLNELEATGRISIKGFYERRIARIFPAFYTYLLTILILMLSHHIDVRWGDLANAATYTWNYSWLWYPPGRVAGEVLGLFWTLSLEEQFYLVWPACLILLGRRWAERLVIACVIFLPFVRIACYFLFPSTRGQLMMMFHTGSDQLLWGAVAAFACRRGAIDRVREFRYRAAIPWLCGLAVFVVGPILEEKARRLSVPLIPSMQCISVVFFVLWLLGGQGGHVRRTLESWPLVQLGLLSYSLYLWQSIFILWDGVAHIWLPLRLLGALLMAILSYRVIEVPMRSIIRRWFAQAQPAH